MNHSQLLEDFLWPATLILARMAAFVTACPLMVPEGGLSICRAALSVALTLVLTFATPYHGSQYLSLQGVLSECFFGALMGLTVKCTLLATQLAASILDTHAGFAFMHQMDPSTQEMEGPIGHLLQTLTGLIFLLGDGYTLIIQALAQSLIDVPPGTVFWQDAWLPSLATHTAHLMLLGLQICAPIVVAIFGAQWVMMILTKVAPQLNIWGIGFLMTAGTALVGLCFICDTWIDTIYYLWQDAAAHLCTLWSA